MIGLFSNSIFPQCKEMQELIKPHSKVLCFSASDMKWQKDNVQEMRIEGRYFNEQYAPFKEFGIDRGDFYIVTPYDNRDFVKWRLEHCDLVVLLGGQMENLTFRLKYYDIWDKLEGKDIIGISAGALVLCDKYYILPHIDDYYTEHEIVEGIGLVKDLRLLVHYDDKNKFHRDNLEYMLNDVKENEHIITLSDTEGLLVGDTIIKIGG